MLFIDDRAGSKLLAPKFPGECELTTLDAGDVAFFGNGPDGDWFVGIEYKAVDDVVKCIQDGRFTGEQLPKMFKLFDMCFLLIEGNYQPDYWGEHVYGSPRLMIPFKGNNGIRFGLSYQAFDNWITSISMMSALAGKPCIIKRARDKKESVEIIKDLYKLFQKPFDKHLSLSRPDNTKMHHVSYEVELVRVKPDDAGYPEFVLRKALYQIQGISWDLAGVLAKRYGLMETLMAVPQKELEDIDRIGKGLAKRIYTVLHGHEDFTAKKRVRK